MRRIGRGFASFDWNRSGILNKEEGREIEEYGYFDMNEEGLTVNARE